MSWQLAAYSLLGLVLVGGFAWYERSRPPARMVTLVAALAALAVAGRLVLAPIPNVVATTDIVLITGYAVGAAPGFAVGGLAAAVSNMWLGQGPWTPWEMAGWGLVGLGGAALAAATRRRLGRVGLAVACGTAGLAYGALLDYSVMVGYGGEQTLDRYLAISARGVPFNVAHAVGNVGFALAAGPALVRMISRYRARFEFRWSDAPRGTRGPVTTAALAAVCVAIALGAVATAAVASERTSAWRWLERTQNRDGGFPATPGGSSSAAMTGWVALGLEAAGRSPLGVRSGGHSALGFLRAHVDGLHSTGDLERTILALDGAGVGARSFGGRDLVAELRGRRSRGGSFEGQVNLTAFGVLAMRATGAPRSATRRSAAWLRKAQNPDGGWGFQPGAGSDPDSTGAVLQGLATASGGGRATRGGASYLRRVQRRSGGFALAGTGAPNTQSTAWAVQGLAAAGVNPAAVRKGRRSPFDYLSRQRAGDGHYRYSSSSDQTPVWVTAQALLAVNRAPFPLTPVPASRSQGAGSGHGRPGVGSSGSRPPNRGGDGWAAADNGRAGTGSADGGRGASASGGGAPRRLSGLPVSATLPRDGPTDGGDGLDGTVPYLAAGFAALAAALVAGFVWCRRRLP